MSLLSRDSPKEAWTDSFPNLKLSFCLTSLKPVCCVQNPDYRAGLGWDYWRKSFIGLLQTTALCHWGAFLKKPGQAPVQPKAHLLHARLPIDNLE